MTIFSGIKPARNRSAAVRDAALLVAVGILFWLVAMQFEFHESLHRLFEDANHWEIDELILAIAVTGVAGFIYGTRRIVELREQIRLRDRAEDRAAWIATHDALTNLPNRNFLESKYASCCKHDESPLHPKLVASIDLDGFKKVNDLLGHSGGDKLLVETSRRLVAAAGDGLVVRMGGDEFIVLLDEMLEDPIAFGNRLIEEIAKPLEINGVQVKVGGSVGLATIGCNSNLAASVHEADVAMYAAKRKRLNTVGVFDPAMEREVHERAQTELALREAVERNDIIPHYQPLVELGTGEVRGFEALARWTDNGGFKAEPDVFISLAEDLGLIVELSEQILRQACTDARSWPNELTLAFNISPTQLSDPLLGLRIARILAETGFPPHRLEIEITETAIARDTEAALRIVDDLRSAGIRIALDDFGTGYSSLSQLSRFAFDAIKIDREFVAAFQSDEKQMKIIKAIIYLGKGLNVETTAEGIEDAAQLDALKDIGCDIGQGFHFAKAMPAGDIRAFLNARETDSLPQTRSA